TPPTSPRNCEPLNEQPASMTPDSIAGGADCTTGAGAGAGAGGGGALAATGAAPEEKPALTVHAAKARGTSEATTCEMFQRRITAGSFPCAMAQLRRSSPRDRCMGAAATPVAGHEPSKSPPEPSVYSASERWVMVNRAPRLRGDAIADK